MMFKLFPVILAIIIVGVAGAVIITKVSQPSEDQSRPGVEHADNGREHATSQDYSGDESPTSGTHANAITWGAYETEVRDDQTIHNLGHGGIYVSYRPDLPQEQIDKLKALLKTGTPLYDFESFLVLKTGCIDGIVPPLVA